ncbi:hypothetical protein RHGRI_010719 [Rhododendron griersonianum]|uniref:Uncharacterized protein n=1 Tax=Rhododendron griersonianum TaxID=479676 RepID=A0AAV6KJG3_9ERIC|nr:hypothetical protein RHGRI_010719 [Rhododendron griersonianum]
MGRAKLVDVGGNDFVEKILRFHVSCECVHCGQVGENIEHLGFDFKRGSPVTFVEWFSRWLENAPDEEAIRDSILLMWTIWPMHNKALFRNVHGSVDNALAFFSGIVNLFRSLCQVPA